MLQIELIPVRETEYDHETEKNKPTIQLNYIVPCGAEFPAEYWDQFSITEKHLDICQACKVLTGKSKQKTGFRQEEVAKLFVNGIFNKSSATKNVFSEERENGGALIHYRTLEAIRLQDGTVIDNSQCWSSGFASCPRVDSDVSLPLTTISNNIALRDSELFSIKIIEQKEDVAFSIGNRYFLFGHDEFTPFLAQLPRAVNSLQDARDSLKPRLVKTAEVLGNEVKRQGDIFFVPSRFTDRDLKDRDIVIEKQTKVKSCSLRLGKYDSRIDSLESEISHLKYYLTTSIERDKLQGIARLEALAKISDARKERLEMIIEIVRTQKPTIETRNIQIYDTNHRPFRKAIYDGQELVKGKIRHTNRQHSMLDLGEIWHYAVKNLAVETWQIRRGFGGGGD